MYDVTATFSRVQASLHGADPVELYVVNASYSGWLPLYYANYNHNIYAYALNASREIINTATLYTGVPIVRGAITSDTQGEISGVSISIPNVDRFVESVIQSYDYLRGREVHMMYTFQRFLPTGSTYMHIGATPDKRSVIKEILYIDSTSSNEDSVSFDCKPKLTIRNAKIPRRRFNVECEWWYMDNYLGSWCDPLNTINSASYPTCDGSLEACRIRGNQKRFGGFTSIPKRGIAIV